MSKQRTLQEIFNAVIENELYCTGNLKKHHSRYMCISLQQAVQKDLITQKEANKAKNSIHKYLARFGKRTLLGALNKINLPYNEIALVNLYLNWKDRPLP